MRLPNRATGLLASQQNRNGILSRLLQLPRQRRASRKARTERQFAKSFQSMSCSVRGDRRTLVRGSSDQFSQEYTAAQLFNEILLQFTAAILCQVSIDLDWKRSERGEEKRKEFSITRTSARSCRRALGYLHRNPRPPPPTCPPLPTIMLLFPVFSGEQTVPFSLPLPPFANARVRAENYSRQRARVSSMDRRGVFQPRGAGVEG